jgi:hypothetical protein
MTVRKFTEDDSVVESIFVTADQQAKKGRTVDAVDAQIESDVAAGKGIPITSMEEMMKFAKAANETKKAFDEQIATLNMTQEQAQFIYEKRITQQGTWRYVAHACYDAWDGNWEPPSNQLMGISLCQEASRVLGIEFDTVEELRANTAKAVEAAIAQVTEEE